MRGKGGPSLGGPQRTREVSEGDDGGGPFARRRDVSSAANTVRHPSHLDGGRDGTSFCSPSEAEGPVGAVPMEPLHSGA